MMFGMEKVLKFLLISFCVFFVHGDTNYPPPIKVVSTPEEIPTCSFNLISTREVLKNALLIKNDTFDFLYPPNGSEKIIFQSGQGFFKYCSGEQITFHRCIEENRLLRESDGATLTYQDLVCKSLVQSAEINNGECFKENHIRSLAVGLNVSNELLPVFWSCFDTKIESVKYVKHVVHPFKTQDYPDALNFIESSISKVNIEALYLNQEATMKKLLGKSMFKEYFKESIGFVRGYLAPNDDFTYGHQRMATMVHSNTAPQWQNFNQGDWLLLEYFIRNHSLSLNTSLHIWTGTKGILTLEDSNGNLQQIYLDPISKKVPVPMHFYKIVVDPRDKFAFAFFGWNFDSLNMKAMPPKAYLCHPRNVPWTSFDENALVYGCAIDDFFLWNEDLSRELKLKVDNCRLHKIC